MDVHAHKPPTVGTHVEMLRPRRFLAGSFEDAVVVGCLTDPAIGVVLELQFEDESRMQRTWPSSTIRLLN
jgi:hypothetical protein